MNTGVVLSLDKRSRKKDGTYPIVLRLFHKRDTRSIPTGYAVADIHWNDDARCVRKNYKGVTSVSRLNNVLAKKKSQALDIITELDDGGLLDGMGVMDVKYRIQNKPKNVEDFFAFTTVIIDDMRQKKQFGNARTYSFVRDVVKKFIGKKKTLGFNEINYNWLQKMEKQHLAKGNSVNSLSVYLRTVRAIYNRAIKAGVAKKDWYPFDSYAIKTVPTAKRAIQAKDIDALLSIDVSENPQLQLSQDFFACSFYLIGMNFKDLCLLKNKNIVDGRVFSK